MIARVTLEIALRKEFDYLVPDDLVSSVEVGSRVQVPFGSRKVYGCVTGLAEESAHPRLKPIFRVVGAQSLVTARVLRLARWIGQYYCCPPEVALKSVLPEAVRHEDAGWRERLVVRMLPLRGDLPRLARRQQEVWNIIEERRELPLQELLALAQTTAATVRRLEDKGLVAVEAQISERDPYSREEILPTAPLPLNGEQAAALAAITAAIDASVAALAAGPQSAPDAQPGAVVSTTAEAPASLPASAGQPVPSEAMDESLPISTERVGISAGGASPKSAATSTTGLSSASQELTQPVIPALASFALPSAEHSAPDDSAAAWARDKNAARVFLLQGVTGSGKTEVYLQAISHVLAKGLGAIVLVPEISLTPQTVERFKARFSSGPQQTLVAVLHSHLSAGERHDEWHKIRQGRARIAIGARSAVFAPVEPLGLIIVDEEHEHTYKQEEAPRYHARDVAVMRGAFEHATVVLGSATPALESFHNCLRKKYELLELRHRADEKKMPLVRVVDMRQTLRKGRIIPIFSPQLQEAIAQRLERKEQTILFLNRRGYATSLQCPLCGHVAGCPNCSISLTYHRPEQKLRCHICAHVENVPARCPNPQCLNPAIRYAGIGTQRVEETLVRLFPHARVKRMDSDALKRKDDFRQILGDFRTGKLDVLLGTQMIAKGLHFPNVTLVGIIYADMALHQPDFRAGERTFQLLTQVSGRAGRGDVEGEVFVQAFTPFHPAIQYARRHDCHGFYDQELEFRRQLKYPPFARVALLTLKGRNEDKVKFAGDHYRRELEKLFPSVPDLFIAGPAPAPLLRAENFYRHQIMLRTTRMRSLSLGLAGVMEQLHPLEGVTVAVDIDAIDLS